MQASEATAYWVTAPGRGDLRREPTPRPGAGQSLLQTRCTGISPGTERLVGRGEVPASCAEAMVCRYMDGSFALPVKYGYSLVGTGVDGALRGERVFVMHPHQDLLAVDDRHALVLPETLPDARATLIPNTETALNAVWDSELRPGEASLIVGGGPVGLLLAFVLQRLDLGPTHLVEVDPARRDLARALPFVDAVGTADEFATGSYRVAFHGTGRGEGLQVALDAVGFEGLVLELSWYGRRPVTVELGSHFHYQRKRILASQVGHIARPKRGQQDHDSRMQEVLRLLDDPAVDALLAEAVDFAQMPELMHHLYHERLATPCPWIRYPSS